MKFKLNCVETRTTSLIKTSCDVETCKTYLIETSWKLLKLI